MVNSEPTEKKEYGAGQSRIDLTDNGDVTLYVPLLEEKLAII